MWSAFGVSYVSPARKKPLKSAAGRGDTVTTELRYEFFRVVDEVAPGLAGEMVEAIGPTYRRRAEHLSGGDLRGFAYIAHGDKDFFAAWLKWAQPYGLHRDSWILDHARALLPAFLSDDPDSANIPRGFGCVPYLVAYPIPGRQITPPEAYRPDQESLAEYKKRVSEYANLVESVARCTGWTDAPAKQYEHLHLSWLVRFQVKRETMVEICKSAKEGLRSVERAIQDMFKLIGLTPRPSTSPSGKRRPGRIL